MLANLIAWWHRFTRAHEWHAELMGRHMRRLVDCEWETRPMSADERQERMEVMAW